jgi:signal transduction histidine kinase
MIRAAAARLGSGIVAKLRAVGAGVTGLVSNRTPLRDRRRAVDTLRWPMLVAVFGLFVTTAAVVWLGYVATSEWKSGASQVLERRANEAVALVRAALSTDMKGAWTTAIVPFSTEMLDEEPPNTLLQVTARTFARFPYPESFILWKRNSPGGPLTYAFNRADRLPRWDAAPPPDDPFPVVVVRQPAALQSVVSEVRKQANSKSPYALIELEINGAPYQVIAHLMYGSYKPHELLGFLAFTVNLDWVRSEYFGPLIAQIDKIGGNQGGLVITVTSDDGQTVASTGGEPASAAELRTHFPLLFIDAALARSIASTRKARDWTVHVRPVPDSILFATLQGARRTFFLMTVAACVSFLALVLTVRADRASVRLASMKSDFVAGVTHELKTPVALIRLVGDTLATGRYTSNQTVQEYARLLSQEASRLTNSIDNLLTYARYAGSPDASIELAPIDAADLVADALQRVRPALEGLEFDVSVNVSPELPPLSVDRGAIVQAIDNVVDNAIKYSKDKRALAITGRLNGTAVQLTFRDSGSGISRQDLPHVFERFYRGRDASSSGSGLGLAIAQRIVNTHGGSIAISSTVDVGTEVAICLPVAHGHHRVR